MNNNRSLDLGRSISFLTEDPNWIVKLLIGGIVTLLSFLLIPIPLILGYQVALIRNTSQGRDVPLPDWDDLGRYFSEGLRATAGIVVYMLPILFLTCCLVAIAAATGDSGGDGGDGAAAFVLCLACLIALISIPLGFAIPAALIRFAQTGRTASMLEFGAIWKLIQGNMQNYVVAVVVGFVASLVASTIASFTFGLLSPWASWWATLVSSHLYGQFLRISTDGGSVDLGGFGGPSMDDPFIPSAFDDLPPAPGAGPESPRSGGF